MAPLPLKFPLRIACLLAAALFAFHSLYAADPGDVTIVDARHYSKVLGEMRNFRVFLPRDYALEPDKRYPVIYFFHGWSQRYFGASTRYSDYDKGDDNGGDNIANFVANHEVIVVKVDGYNRSPDEAYYVRPWNVSPVETYRQFPLYFPELVDHVDATWRTIPDREHRGISGLSMGGFMTFWVGGKYPHLLSAAGNFCGSPEFFVGPRDFPVEYRHLDMAGNYGGMKLRLNYGNKDFIRGYHEDLNRVWPQLIDNYEYKVYDAEHTTCGMADMFSFILGTFKNPPSRPTTWHHTDVYPEFSVWDYTVATDRTVPGFTVLENVNADGFRCAVREFLPDGELLRHVNVTIRTSPRYQKNAWYTINDINPDTGEASHRKIRSDDEGRLIIPIDGGIHEIGIHESNDRPVLTIASVDLQGRRWATHGADIAVTVKILNKGGAPAENIQAMLTATRPTATVSKGKASLGDIPVNEVKAATTALVFRVASGSVEVERLKLTLKDDRGNVWEDHFDIELKEAAGRITDFIVADGKTFAVAKAGTQTETVMLGEGNGDGVANPGESIVILVKDQDKLWRTDLAGGDPYLNPFGIKVRKSDNWASTDHVGGSAKYDVPLISSDCPQNHPLEFFVEYWLPDPPLHVRRQGVVRFPVKGNDTTSPSVGWVVVSGDNVVQVKVRDGASIKKVTATLIPDDQTKRQDNTKSEIASILSDDGHDGDRTAGDLVFSQKIADQYFGVYRLVITAEDAFGNTTTHKPEETFVLH